MNSAPSGAQTASITASMSVWSTLGDDTATSSLNIHGLASAISLGRATGMDSAILPASFSSMVHSQSSTLFPKEAKHIGRPRSQTFAAASKPRALAVDNNENSLCSISFSGSIGGSLTSLFKWISSGNPKSLPNSVTPAAPASAPTRCALPNPPIINTAFPGTDEWYIKELELSFDRVKQEGVAEGDTRDRWIDACWEASRVAQDIGFGPRSTLAFVKSLIDMGPKSQPLIDALMEKSRAVHAKRAAGVLPVDGFWGRPLAAKVEQKIVEGSQTLAKRVSKLTSRVSNTTRKTVLNLFGDQT